MKWVNVVFVFALVLAPLTGYCEKGNSSNPNFIVYGLSDNGEPAGLLGPVCFPGDPCGLGPKQLPAGPVCYPGEPCGKGGTADSAQVQLRDGTHKPQLTARQWITAALGPVCYPGGPCGSGRKIISIGPVCYPGEPCGLGGGKP